jgi:PIN domain nuclease of toxin-antitoxin system
VILLDTHALLWWLRGSGLGPEATSLVSSDAVVCVSTATVWEIGIKVAAGKLDFPVDGLLAILETEDFDVVPMTAHHALAAARLPPHHQDPFDRMLVAQAQSEGLRLLTADRELGAYDVTVIPADR